MCANLQKELREATKELAALKASESSVEKVRAKAADEAKKLRTKLDETTKERDRAALDLKAARLEARALTTQLEQLRAEAQVPRPALRASFLPRPVLLLSGDGMLFAYAS